MSERASQAAHRAAKLLRGPREIVQRFRGVQERNERRDERSREEQVEQ